MARPVILELQAAIPGRAEKEESTSKSKGGLEIDIFHRGIGYQIEN